MKPDVIAPWTLGWRAGLAALGVAILSPALAGDQMTVQRAIATGIDVAVEIRTSPDKLGGATNDQLTLIFSNASAELQRTPPTPLFGADIVTEFSFSGRDARPGATLTFRRTMSDEKFLAARYIRLINHGADSWGGESISLSVNGRRVLDRQSLYPRKGGQPNGGVGSGFVVSGFVVSGFVGSAGAAGRGASGVRGDSSLKRSRN